MPLKYLLGAVGDVYCLSNTFRMLVYIVNEKYLHVYWSVIPNCIYGNVRINLQDTCLAPHFDETIYYSGIHLMQYLILE